MRNDLHEPESAAFLAAIVESSDDAIISKDLNGIITSWNRGAERMFGYGAQEVIGRPVTILIPPDHLNEEPKILDRIRRGDRIDHYETVRRRKDHSLIDISLTVSPIKDLGGKIIGASKIARDISEQRRAQEKLRQSEERFRVTLASIGDGVIATDKKGRVTFINPVAEQLTGWNRPEVLGVPLEAMFKIVNEITRQPVENPVARVLREGVIVGLANHTILISKDKKEWPIDDSAAPIREPGGELSGVVLVFRDATRQREAELAARKLAAVVENSQDAIYTTDLDGVVTAWNKGSEQIFGYAAREAIGKDLTSLILPAARRSEESSIIEQLRKGEQVEHYETSRRTRDGREIDVSLAVSLLKDPASGDIIGISKIARDITEHKRSEEAVREAGERYRTLFNAMDEGFCVVQMIFDERNQPTDYRFLEINPAFEKQTGLRNAEGKTMREIAPQHEEHWFEIYGKVALTGEPARMENQAQALNRWFDVYAYRVGPPELRKVAVLFTDITERKKSEQALAQAQKDMEDYTRNLEAQVADRTEHLQQTIADLEAFSFTISHDLRSPLRAMQGFAEVVLSEYADKLDAHGRDYLERISNSAMRLDKLILEVLTYSRVGRAELSIKPIDLDKLIDDVMHSYPSIQSSQAEINVKRPLPPVLGNHSSLVQCVSNLLDNAVKFIPPGGRAKVRVWADKEDSKVRFCVKDNGIGIPDYSLSRIFEPFQRAHPRAGYEGTGMGLAIVRKAVQRMGGTIGVQSREAHGSTFWIELPAAD